MANSTNTTAVLNTASEINTTVYICIHFIMPCAVAIGIIGNLLSILVFARREMIKFCVSIFTIVLALSDILLLITSLFNIILPVFLNEPLSDKSAFWWYVAKRNLFSLPTSQEQPESVSVKDHESSDSIESKRAGLFSVFPKADFCQTI